MQDLHHLSAQQAAVAVANKKISSRELVQACLDRIQEREPQVAAWAYLNPEQALEQARLCDSGPVRGPLHGVPVGIKDVFDTRDMPTEYGASIYQGHQPQRDAACVNLVRRAGGIILGKTVTTEFALYQPSKTRNPHNVAYTPGGSSSGSAAAVADHHVPLAFGTQSSGSIIRPAAFCGVVGYKPTIQMFAVDGMKPLGASLDTVGLISRTVDDLALMWEVLHARKLGTTRPAVSQWRVGLCRTPYWDQCGPEQRDTLLETGRRLARHGLHVEDIVLPDVFGTLNRLHARLLAYEVARNYVYEYEPARRDMLGPATREVIAEGWEVSTEQYLLIRATLRHAIAQFTALCASLDALIVPAAAGEAPPIATTGDPVFNRMWTFLGVPAITIPAGTGPNGLPLGVQFVGKTDSDLNLLALCQDAEKVLKAARTP